jgi:glycosyltransferase involved in cell wall biosynthesis
VKVANLVFNSFKNDSRVLKESISLANAGYTVEVIAHHDIGLKKYEVENNFTIRRLSYLNRKKSKGIFSKLGAYLKYIKLSVQHCKDFNILHCNDLDTLPIAFIIKRFLNKDIKVIYDAHEHETERHHQSNFDKNVLKVVEKFLLKYVDEVITVSEPIADDYVKLYDIKKPTLIYNTPKKVSIEKKNIFREKFNIPREHTIFLYQGGLQPRRGILEFLELVKDKKNVSYVIMGFGALKEKILEKIKNQPNLYFHDAVSPDILLDYTSSADIGVCIEENLCKSWDLALPNKMFEYAMVDLPIIVSGLSELKRFVLENDTGYVIEDIFDKNEFDKLFPKILETHHNKNINIQKIKKIYNWQNQEEKLLKLYDKLNIKQTIKPFKIGAVRDD